MAPISSNDTRSEKKLIEERRRHIQNLVNSEGRALVSELAEELKVSEVTVRNDLNVLSKRGLISRTHGGALRVGPAVLDISLVEKEKLHRPEKTAIASLAASLVQEGMSIILDSGSTTTQIARALLPKRSITVITNALNIALELRDSDGIEVILLGGLLRKESSSVVGPLTQLALKPLNADILFLGVDGVDPDVGFTTPNLAEAEVNRRMIEASREVIVVTDPSKFGKRSLAVICGPDEVSKIVTTPELPPVYLKHFSSLGVEVLLA